MLSDPPDFVLFTDADIGYAPETLTALVTRAHRDGLVLASLMAKLHCESFAERALIPAFIFFFQMLYPFAWVNRPGNATAAAAGGCMLARREALQAAGGIAAVRGHLIDDCALGRLMKSQGPIWLGLTSRARSLRVFRSVGEIRAMISRSAYAQLRYSPWLLLGTVVAIAVTCLAPPLLAAGATGATRWLALAAWAEMALALQPTLRFYGLSRWWGIGDAGNRGRVSRVHAGLGAAALARQGRHVEGPYASSGAERAIMGAMGTRRGQFAGSEYTSGLDCRKRGRDCRTAPRMETNVVDARPFSTARWRG